MLNLDQQHSFEQETSAGTEALLSDLSVDLLREDEIKGVEELAPGKCLLPILWNNKEYDIIMKKDSESGCLQTEILVRIGNEVESLEVEDNPNEISTFEGFCEYVHQLVSQHIDKDIVGRLDKKNLHAYAILFEGVEKIHVAAKPVGRSGPNKVIIPYELDNKKVKFECVVFEDGSVSIRGKKETYATSREFITTVIPGGSGPLSGVEDISSLIDPLLDEHFSADRPQIDHKYKDAYTLLTDDSVAKIFEEADFMQYEENRYTYSILNDVFKSDLKGKINFGKIIDETTQFNLILEAVIDFNIGLGYERADNDSDDVFLPKNISFYQLYINELNTHKKLAEKKLEVEKPPVVEDEPKTGSFKSVVTHLLDYGKGGRVQVGEKHRKSVENYNYMKGYLGRFDADVKGTHLGRLDYVKKLFKESKYELPRLVRELGPYVPMQESGYDHAGENYASAAGIWQITRERARLLGLIVNSQVDERMNFKLATQKSLKYYSQIYKEIIDESPFNELSEGFGLTYADKQLVLGFCTINGFNSGERHMIRAFRTIKKYPVEYNKCQAMMKKHGKGPGMILYITNVYSPQYKKYQSGQKYKYASESSEYVYRILKYRDLDHAHPDDLTTR